MSKLNINRNIFLEREELLRWQEFLINSNVNQVFLKNTLTWGIIDTSGGTTPLDFKVEVGTTSGTVKISSESKALTESGLLISQSVVDNVAIPADGSFYWLKIGHKYTNLEVGTCNIAVDGQVAGSGTKFLDVIRGQITEVPVKIIFPDSVINTSVYEVVSAVDNENLILSSTNLLAESGQKYAVIGSTPLGDTVTNSQKEGLYQYDSCEITQVLETIFDTEPAGKVSNEEFWIARVTNNSGAITIEDKRTEYWTYFIRGVNDKLDRNLNLSDLQDVTVARNSLSVYSKSEVDNLLNLTEVGWTSMVRGSAAQEAAFDIKISRIGRTCTITGKFLTVDGTPIDSIVASIPLLTLAGSSETNINLSSNIYWQGTTVDTTDKNRGIAFKIPPFGSSSDLQLKVLESVQSCQVAFTISFNLI